MKKSSNQTDNRVTLRKVLIPMGMHFGVPLTASGNTATPMEISRTNQIQMARC